MEDVPVSIEDVNGNTYASTGVLTVIHICHRNLVSGVSSTSVYL